MLCLGKFHSILLLIICSGLIQWSYSTEQKNSLPSANLQFHYHPQIPTTPQLLTRFEFAHDDYVEYEGRHNYWHLMYGVLIPMTVELWDRFSLVIQQHQHDELQEGRLTVQIGNIGNVTNHSQLMQYFDDFLNENIEVKFLNNTQQPPAQSPVVYLKRCDIPILKVPVPRYWQLTSNSNTNSSNSSSSSRSSSSSISSSSSSYNVVNTTATTNEVKYRSYFETCFEENIYVRFRHYLGLLTPSDWGKQVSIPHDLDKTKHVLIILRRCIPEALLNGEPHKHHAICFEHTSSKYQRIVDGLHRLGFTTHSTYLDNTTIKTQALMFANASIIIIPHGAAIANCIFARSGTLIVEITPYILMREINPKGILHRAGLHVQKISIARSMLQKLCRRFWSWGVLLRHIVLPSTTESYAATNELLKGCDDWTCYEVNEVLEVISSEYRALQGVLKKVYM
jgi:hypothetical protein